MANDLVPDLLRDQDCFEVSQEIETTDLVEMNQGTCVTDNQRPRISLGHEDPTPRPPSEAPP